MKTGREGAGYFQSYGIAGQIGVEMDNTIRTDRRFAIIDEWVLNLDISDRALRLYAILMRYADNETHKAFPSRRTLAERLRCSAASVDRAISELVEAGALSKEQRFNSSLIFTIHTYPNEVGSPVTRGVITDDKGGSSPVMRGVISGDDLTRTTELEPKNDNHLTKKPQPKTADDYEPSEAITSDFEERYPGLRLDMELAKFRDHHMANGSKFADWDRAMRKWLRQASEWSKDARAARASMSTDSEWEQWKKENGYS